MVKAGDSIPDIELLEGTPDKKVQLSKELASGKGLIIGVPAAFSPACTARHIPEYMNSKNLKDAGKVFVVAVNDPFVMAAWAESLDPGSKSGIRFLSDRAGAFTKALGSDTSFEFPGAFGDARAKRMAIVTEDGKVGKVFIEPDNIGVEESAAKNVIGE